MMEKRVLVCSIPCWNNKTGFDTFSNLLDGYDTDKVANLYLREDVPDSPVCHNYFCISENSVIKSIFDRKIKTGKRVFDDKTIIQEKTKDIAVVANMYKNNAVKRNYLFLYAREILWMIGRWKTKELDAFLDEFKPDVVLFSMEGYIHFNRINRYILKKTKAKGIGYFWDDNFTYRQSNHLGHRIYRFFQRRDLKKTAKLCSVFFAITQKTKEEADEFFGIDCKILTKIINFDGVEFEPTNSSLPLKMVYTGNLLIGRFDTIKLVGEALDEVNKNGLKVELDVYTTTVLNEEQKRGLSPYVHILGAIPQTEVARVQKEADILLFAEAVNGPNSKIARLSFSTKLTDYFRSGKCILAVGNPDTAPMDYLKEEDIALIAFDKDGIAKALNSMADNLDIINSYGQKAFDCGKRNHSKQMIQEKLFNVFNN